MELKCCSVENPLLSTVKTVSNLVGYNEKISWVLNFERCFFIIGESFCRCYCLFICGGDHETCLLRKTLLARILYCTYTFVLKHGLLTINVLISKGPKHEDFGDCSTPCKANSALNNPAGQRVARCRWNEDGSCLDKTESCYGEN